MIQAEAVARLVGGGVSRVLGIAVGQVGGEDICDVGHRGLGEVTNVGVAAVGPSRPASGAPDHHLLGRTVCHVDRRHGRDVEVERRIIFGDVAPDLLDRRQLSVAEGGGVSVLVEGGSADVLVWAIRAFGIAREVEVERGGCAGRLLSAGAELRGCLVPRVGVEPD